MRSIIGILALLVLTIWPSSAAFAHEERESQFPPGHGSVPVHRTVKQAADVIVVCKGDSDERIAKIGKAKVRRFNERLLKQCDHRNLRAAVDAVKVERTNIYVLPGRYRERPSRNAACTEGYDGGVVEYDLIVSCGEVVNLVTIAGDDPEDPDIVCDNQLCNLQITGTGTKPSAVRFTGGFNAQGDWVKHNGIKADRADGFYLANMTVDLFRENAVYVHETDGYVLDRPVTKNNDLYGVLTFASDHGLIQRCDASHNGDSGIYPGSAADVNAQSKDTGPLTRWAVEVRNCNMHHNTLGFSGTAGNSVYVHDNRIHHNGIGYVVESIPAGHPGMPQGPRLVHRQRDLLQQRQLLRQRPWRRRSLSRGQARGSWSPARRGLPGLRPAGRHRRDDDRQPQLRQRQPLLRQLALRRDALLGPAGGAMATTTRRTRPTTPTSMPSPRTRWATAPTAACCPTASTSGGTTRASATAGRTTSPRKGRPSRTTPQPAPCPTVVTARRSR
ncbi:right-handed parallel beta-helix repeat-containing protein [Nocardioides sp. B-3]|uniref:right-handed parallel beta-helix repeat-containing protein n=1 Tax=Nocardioides sp. B-3 TaxID=2895565 RepID=UPI0021539C4D|nr:right-handed parallel beta-helix repeat-containing protein [Nocardioides sp. B-3]UUZ59382.1 right-handed parallel beta-helix repeat-containing protein [Nocardioides sp. B-3]